MDEKIIIGIDILLLNDLLNSGVISRIVYDKAVQMLAGNQEIYYAA